MQVCVFDPDGGAPVTPHVCSLKLRFSARFGALVANLHFPGRENADCISNGKSAEFGPGIRGMCFFEELAMSLTG